MDNILDLFGKAINALAKLLLLVFLIYLFTLFRPVMAKISTGLEKGDYLVSEFDSPVLQFKMQKLIGEDTKIGKEDDISPLEQEVIKRTNLFEEKTPVSGEPLLLWSYVGRYKNGKNGKFLRKYFNVEKIPEPKSTITAISDVYRRSDKPTEINKEWIKGDIVGILNYGAQLEVHEVVFVPGSDKTELIWVSGKMLPPKVY